MKLIGGDSGRVEHEEFVDQVMLAPSERAVVDVLVERPGQLALEHHTPDRTYRLATITVTERAGRAFAGGGSSRCCDGRRSWPPSGRAWTTWLAAPPDKMLALVAQMDDLAAPRAGPGHLRLPDASRGDQRREPGPLPQVRHEAARQQVHRCTRPATPARCTRR